MKLFVVQTRELFNRERGKSISKKLNMGDTYSSKIETSLIIQQHLLDYDQLQCIDRKDTMIYGNVKAMIPLVRERLGLEFEPNNDQKAKYRRGALEPLRESMAFGIMTKSQVGYIPSVDICFTEDEETFLKDTYVFQSLISKELYKHEATRNTLDNSECATLSLASEIRKLRECNDFSADAIKDESVSQLV